MEKNTKLYGSNEEVMDYRPSKIQYRERKSIRNMSQKLSDERLKFMDDTPLSELSIGIEDGKTVRKLRRIIEKRVCQDWWKSRPKSEYSNFSRSSTKKWVTNQFKNIYHCVPEGFHYCA